jgi:hypothetical protein
MGYFENLNLSSELSVQKEFFLKLSEMMIEDIYSGKIAYETMLWLTKKCKNKELVKNLDQNPSFYKYKRGLNLDIYEKISFDCDFTKAFNSAASDFLFSEISDNKDVENYIYFIVYLLKKDFDYDINIFDNDENYQISKHFWNI